MSLLAFENSPSTISLPIHSEAVEFSDDASSGAWKLTRAHVELAAAAVVLGDLLVGSKPKVADVHRRAVLGAEDVLRLQVTMVDALRVAMMNSVQYL